MKVKDGELTIIARIKVGRKGSTYFSDDLRVDGYMGELEAIANACILVIRKPGLTQGCH